MEAQAFEPQEQRAAKQFAEMKQLQEKQIRAANGEKNVIKSVTANRDKNIQIAETDKDYVHVAVSTNHLDAENKRFITEARILPIHANQFDQMVAANAFAAYDDVKVIHDPRPNAPQEYTLKPLQPGEVPIIDPAVLRANDAALAAREQKAKDAEKRADDKIAELQKLIDAQQKSNEQASAKQSAADKKAAADAKAKADADKTILPPPPDGTGV